MNLIRIAWIALRELLHEKAFYILFCLAIASLVFSALLGQLTYAEQAKLTLDFMLGSTHLSVILFSVFMGISLFQREILSGSISMVLSKPISRTTFLLGKFLGQALFQVILSFCMGILIAVFLMRFEAPHSMVPIAQTLCLISLEAAILSSITYLFAVNTGAVTAAILTLAIFAVGHTRGLITSTLKGASQDSQWTIVRTIVPDLEIFNMKHLASYGQSISWNEFGWAVLYAGICLAFYLTIATLCFERKDIYT